MQEQSLPKSDSASGYMAAFEDSMENDNFNHSLLGLVNEPENFAGTSGIQAVSN